MKQITYTIKSEVGLHMLPASKLTSVTERFDSKITITKAGKTMNGKSVMGLISLCCRKGDEIIVDIDGKDEELAYNRILDHLEENL